MMLTLTCGQPVDVGLARAEVAALDRVVEQPVDAVAVVAVVLGGVDAALRGDAVRPARAVLIAEAGDLVALLAERGGGRRPGQAGAHDDHRQLAPIRRVDQLGLELAGVPALLEPARRHLLVDEPIPHRVEAGGHVGLHGAHLPTHPNSTEYGTIKNPAVITIATTTATTLRWRRRRTLVFAPNVANALQNPCRRWNPTAISAIV